MTPVALLGWLCALHPDLSNVRPMLPELPLALMIADGLAFALVDATLEELAQRWPARPDPRPHRR